MPDINVGNIARGYQYQVFKLRDVDPSGLSNKYTRTFADRTKNASTFGTFSTNVSNNESQNSRNPPYLLSVRSKST